MNRVACSAQFYQLGDQGSFKINVTLAIPHDIHIQLDASILSLVYIDLGYSDWLLTEVDLGETQRRKGARKCGGEDGLNYLLDHPAASDIDVGP